MSRWRLRTWMKDQPSVALKTHYQHQCQACMIIRVKKQATDMADRFNLVPVQVKWSLEVLSGSINGWNIVAHDRNYIIGKHND